MFTSTDLEELFILQIAFLKRKNFPAEVIASLRSKRGSVLKLAEKSTAASMPFVPVIPNITINWMKQMTLFMSGGIGVREHDVYVTYNGFAYNEEKTSIYNHHAEPYFMMDIELLPLEEVCIPTSWEQQAHDARVHLASKGLIAMNHVEALSFAFFSKEFALSSESWQQLCALGTSWDGYECPGIYKGRDWPVGINWMNLNLNSDQMLTVTANVKTDVDQIKISAYHQAL